MNRQHTEEKIQPYNYNKGHVIGKEISYTLPNWKRFKNNYNTGKAAVIQAHPYTAHGKINWYRSFGDEFDNMCEDIQENNVKYNNQ